VKREQAEYEWTAYPFGLKASWRLVLGVPRRVVDAVRWNRSVIPTWRSYVVAGLVGLVLGLALYFAFAWPWWPFPVAALVVTAIAFAATALTSPAARSNTARDLREAVPISPERAYLRRRLDQVKPYLKADVPIYGLQPEWQGLRYFGLLEDDGRQFAGWGLTHRLEDPAEPELEVITYRTPVSRGEAVVEVAASGDDDFDDLLERSEGQWRTLVVTVDGEASEFSLLAHQDEWWAYRTIGGRGVLLHGMQGYPREGIELARVQDFTPYLDGHVEMLRRLGTA